MIDETLFIQELQSAKSKEKAFKQLVQLYKERLYWHIRKIVLIHDDADDVLQNTFIKVFKNIDNFKGESQLFSWMYRIATNEAITFLNKKNKNQAVDIESYHQAVGKTLQDDVYFEGDEVQIILQKAIATLPQKQQLVFNMKYFEELKYEEIADILQTSVGALKASYFHAVKKIECYIKNNTD